MIEFNDVTYSYRTGNHNALDHISLNFRQGEWTSVIGHNGSGKSTLVKILMGVLEGYEGEIKVDGEVMTEENLPDIRKRFAIVFQNPDNQFVGATVEDDVAFGLENNGVGRDEMVNRVEEALRSVNMLEYRTHEPSRLSGGQKQRVAIAGALAMQPDLLILDEATSMLDPQGRREVLEILREIHREKLTTLIYITHDLAEIGVSDHAVVMKDGRVINEGTVEEIYQDTDALVSSRLVLPFTISLADRLLDGCYMSYDELVERL
ncbi:energy-coupling factor transporter ATPase [Salinicoccus halodurans]|uniref:Cobalt transporter ATP-binding subunit n=1 Tax=Salinicoccus halodurans TaxID=407035 RepID=A0A0F7D3S7_9STAP|nr:energy-coupling factor transporter ATPase [Salinicoccus halodurans]AKG73005.1 cobalt transporter ATP-binding subunit [Salinicoccus halodurans]SFK77291.1 energy-coupling factor transport system ATP-binding protein [Salinicoccus halodurans]